MKLFLAIVIAYSLPLFCMEKQENVCKKLPKARVEVIKVTNVSTQLFTDISKIIDESFHIFMVDLTASPIVKELAKYQYLELIYQSLDPKYSKEMTEIELRAAIEIILEQKLVKSGIDKKRKFTEIKPKEFLCKTVYDSNKRLCFNINLNGNAEVQTLDKNKGIGNIVEAVIDNKDQLVKQLLQQPGANVNERNSEGEPLLIIATKLGNFSTVKILIDLGADVKLTDSLGNNALHHAVKLDDNYKILVKYLIDAGVEVNGVNNFGLTPLAIALLQ